MNEPHAYTVIAYRYGDCWYTVDEVYAARHSAQQSLWKANPYCATGIYHAWENGREIPEWVIEMARPLLAAA